MSQLTGPQYRQLHAALLSAFPTRADLEQMLLFGMDVSLTMVTNGTNLSEDVFRLIQWAQAQGRLGELVASAREANAGNVDLRAIGEALQRPTGTETTLSAGAEVNYAIPVLRELITAALSDSEITTLTFDYFPDVYNEFTSGMAKGDRIQRLIEYAVRRNALDRLVAAIKEQNPSQYERYRKRLIA